MKKKTKIIIIIIASLFVIIGAIVAYNIFSDETRLSISERSWLDNNISTIQNINVINDNAVFGSSGTGVYFDLLNDFSDNYDLEINPVVISNNDLSNGVSLAMGNTVSDKDKVIYIDHYVLVAKEYELVRDYGDLNGKTVGIINSNLAYVSNYLSNITLNYNQYATDAEMQDAFSKNEIQYMIVPCVSYLDYVVSNSLYVIEHFSDINVYYALFNYKSSELGSILGKYIISWSENFNDSFDKYEFEMFSSRLGISETEVDAMRSMDYEYGFVNTSPYEVISGGNYGGIVAVYLNKFSNFADLDIKFTKYRNYNKFLRAINKGDIDIYYNYYNYSNDYKSVNGEMAINYSVIAKCSNPVVINSLNSLKGKEVYVLENSLISSKLASIGGINIKTYSSTKELFKVAKKDSIIVLDKNVFEYYKSDKLKNYSERNEGYLQSEYSFKVNNNNAFYKLFERYINTIDYHETLNKGLFNHYETIKSGTLLGKMAKYFLCALFITFIIVYVLYRKTKKITIVKRIKREDKIKYIDQLTSLKNRNYLKENIENWNNNKVYPQTMIVMDLNNIQYINDTLGYDEGDKQIKALANILIKTQLDYSDIMRTDGNEFLIYLIGYSQKQVTSYIHKLSKELKKLPYEYGAAIGYSVINDDIKTVEDAINEAVEEMKAQKKASGGDEKNN